MPGQYRLQQLMHACKLFDDLVVPETKDGISFSVEHPGATEIVFYLDTVRMLRTVEFNDQHPLPASEVGDERADRVLPHELEAVKGPVPNKIPEPALWVGHFLSEATSARDRGGRTNGPHPALRATLSPLGRGEVGASFAVTAHSTISAVSTTA
jgi:hypothetical protein